MNRSSWYLVAGVLLIAGGGSVPWYAPPDDLGAFAVGAAVGVLGILWLARGLQLALDEAVGLEDGGDG